MDWSNIDSFEGFGEYYTHSDKNSCDKCCNKLDAKTFYNFHSGQYCIDLCKKCIKPEKDKYVKDFMNLTFVDRTNMTIEEKPLSWFCDICGCQLGGGHKWYYENNDDICFDCEKLLHVPFKQYSNLYLNDRDTCLDMSEINATTQRIFPILLTKNNFSPSNKCNYIDCIKYANFDIGKMKHWCMLKDSLSDIPFIDATAFIIVNCVDGRVASGIYDDHGRVALNLLYNSPEDFISAYDSWKKIKKNEQEIVNLKKNFDDKSFCEYEELAEICDGFSSYIRLHKQMGYYYGY